MLRPKQFVAFDGNHVLRQYISGVINSLIPLVAMLLSL